MPYIVDTAVNVKNTIYFYGGGCDPRLIAFSLVCGYGFYKYRQWSRSNPNSVLFVPRVKSLPTGVLFITLDGLAQPISFSCHSLGASQKRAITGTAPVSKRRKFAPPPKS